VSQGLAWQSFCQASFMWRAHGRKASPALRAAAQLPSNSVIRAQGLFSLRNIYQM
jgi:hypothetical protein